MDYTNATEHANADQHAHVTYYDRERLLSFAWNGVWVDGRTDTKAEAFRCMSKITGSRRVILNPPSGYPVVAGAIARNHGCTALYPGTP